LSSLLSAFFFAAGFASPLSSLSLSLSDAESSSSSAAASAQQVQAMTTNQLTMSGRTFSLEELIKAWLSWLPLVEDLDEAHFSHNLLVRLVLSNHAVVMGNGNENVPRILKIFARVMDDDDLVSDDNSEQMKNIWRSIQNTLPSGVFDTLWAMFGDQEKEWLTGSLIESVQTRLNL